MPLHMPAKQELARRGWTVWFSLALAEGEAFADLDGDVGSFELMATVTGDHGVWDDPVDFDASPLYQNQPGVLRLLSYRLLIGLVNRRVVAVRFGYTEADAT